MFGRLKDIQPASFFLYTALLFELLLNLVTPPLQAPDEFSHFYRTYQVSEGYFYPVKQDQRLGGYMPQGILDYTDQYRPSAFILEYTLTYREMVRSFKIKLNGPNRKFQDFANTAYYSPISYLPQACMVFLLRQLDAPPAVMYYGGRLFVFIIWLLCMYNILRKLPAFRWLFTALMLLPMGLYQVNSFSADAVTNILSFLFIGTVIRHVFVTPAITPGHIFFLALLLSLLTLAKVVYIGLIPLLLLIPKNKFKTPAQRWVGLGLLLAVSAILFTWWSGRVVSYYIPIKDYNPQYKDLACLSPCGDYYAQQNYILSHGTYFLKVIAHSLFDHPRTYLSGFIGVFGNGDVGLPMWVYWLSYLILMGAAFTERNTYSFSLAQKAILLSAAAFALVLLLLSQHLIWDCVGEGVVDLLQGRYLTPMGPLVFLLFSNSGTTLRLCSPVFVIPGMLLINGYCCKKVFDRFFTGPTQEIKEIYCDAEETDTYGSFKTSDPEAFMNNANCRDSTQHRSGRYSALLSPQSPYCFTYKFRNLKRGDLLEVEAWEKGQGCLLVFSAKQSGCGDFYFGATFKSYRDKDGWLRIKNVCSYPLNCNNAEIVFYAWNPGKTNIYLDDIKLSIKKFNHH